jgi:hypothetical protein
MVLVMPPKPPFREGEGASFVDSAKQSFGGVRTLERLPRVRVASSAPGERRTPGFVRCLAALLPPSFLATTRRGG